MGKYRLRTNLRSRLPAWCLAFLPKGGRDCGEHEWYKSADNEYHCYHCRVGVRTTRPDHWPASPPPD
ncbi:hypothetical protein [Krasilnikovia sp. MM14-A1004]|uniref:hypothetical protein n=1 Tax=Krasilnikovia sp. MM14-A1004 TaxID=3373541 RepID=UPI00399D1316